MLSISADSSSSVAGRSPHKLVKKRGWVVAISAYAG
ncbi:hypothetical protein WLH_05894 [Escherichia coli O25b:H4]|uniref:Uncharacterized protein n=1 Tax=Escherichia coli O25b:H4 TaxID=941280 RepID=A0A192CMR0_ECO25|nr:hypothetical protein WLH_05894 [Escherichia coli O25b:H4]